jgi:hypothetical protein
VVVHACNPGYSTQKVEIGGSWSKTSLNKKQETLSEKNKLKQKRVEFLAEVVESLPSKCKALSSKSDTAKNNPEY